MKKIVLFLIAMLAAVMPMRADYTLQFVESTSTSDASTAYSMDVSKVFTDASNVVGEVTNVTSVYPAKKGYGAKFGSSKAAGNLKFTLLQSTYVAAILKVAAYTTTTSVTLSVNGMELPVEMPADGSPVEVTYSPGASFETMEITTAATTRFYLVSVTLVEQGTSGGGTTGGGTSILKGNAVWPIFMDGITRQQESSKIVADFTNDGQERNFYIWNNTYQGENVYGGNFYDNGDVYLSLTVQNEGWSGFGMNILAGNNSWDAAVNLWQNIHSNPEKYYLHLALKSTDYASHDFYVFDDLTTRFTIGTTPQDSSSVIIGDFARDGEWHEFDVPMSMFAMSPDFTSTDGMNIFIALSGGVAGTQLNLDAVYFYEKNEQTDGGDTSDPCAIKSFPWEENFDAVPITADEVIPTCWDNSMSSESVAAFNKWSYYTSENLNSQCVRFDSYNNQSGEWNILKTPTMTLPQGMALFVKYKNPTGGTFSILVYGADGSATALKPNLPNSSAWRVEKIDLSQYVGQMVSFGFEGVSNWGNGDAYIYIDKVAVMSNTQELDTESDPDFGPQIIIEEYQTLRVELARIGRVEPGWYDVMVSNMKTLPTVTSMNPDLLRIDSVRFVDGAGEAVSNPADAVSLRIHYATTPTTLGYLEGTINIVAGQISATLPFAVNVTEVYELVPLNPEEALHLTAAPGEMLTFTLKFMHTGFTPDQVSAGFPYGVSTEGYELGQLYSMNDTVMALDVHISGQKNGVYSTEVMLEAHAGVCFSDVTAYVRFETKISDSWIQKLTKEINFGVLPMNSGVYADTVYLKYHNVNLDSVVVGTNIQSYEGEPYIPCGVGNTIILNDSILAVPVECNTNIVEVDPGSYTLRFYYVVYDDGVVTDEDTDIPVKMTFVAPEFRIAEELDFGTMLFDETKSMKLQFEAQYYDISDIEVSSFSDILTVSNVIEIVDSTASTSQGAWKKYEVTVTLNAYEVGNLYQDLFCRFGSMESVVTVKAFIPQPTVTIMQEAYDFGKIPQNSGAYPAEILVTFSNALSERIGYGIRNQNEADTSWVPVGFADRVLRDSTTLVVNMMLNSDGLAVGKYDWFFFVSYGKEIYAIPVMANIVQASQIEIIPEVIDFGDVPFSSLVNDYISTEVKIATTSVHQAVASIEGDSAFSLSQFTFGPTESYFGNRLEQDLTIYALSDRMGQHMAELKLNGDSGKTVAVAQVMMNVVPRPVLYDTIRATICDNETYPFDGKMLNVAGTYSETTKTIYGGDSITTLVLTVLPTLYGDAYASIRDYEYYIFQGDTIREAGDFLYPLSKASSIGCDSIVTLHLTVLETMYRTEDATICSNSSYTFYGDAYTEAGTYTHRIENTQLGDSVITLNLTVLPTKTGEDFATIRDYEIYYYEGDSLSKAGDYTYTLVAENGCDSTVTLHLTVLETMYRTEEATICSNQSYTFYDEVYSQAGQYTHRIENTQLGDSVITLNLTVLPTKTGEDFATIRDYEIYYYEGDSLSKAGDYTYTLVAANGCDSTVTLHLTVLETMYRTENATICANQSYIFYGEKYSQAGQYTHRIENTQLGDSVITLNLTVLPTKTGEASATIRDYEIYYYEGDSLSKAGDYTYTLVAANGCDSTVTLHLTVLATMYRTEDATICANQSYTFYGDAYTEAGTYTHRIENTQLGDSVITLNLTVLPTKTGEASAAIRDYEIYYYEGDSLSKAGDYTYTLIAANGCDSTVTLHLTVLETMYRTEEATICSNSSYTFYGDAYTEAGTYTHRIENTQLGDSVITLNLTVLPTKTGEDFATIRDYEIYYYEGDSLSKAGDYTYTLVAANGCDSVVTLHLTVLETMYRTENATICSNGSYTFYGDAYTEAGTYTHRIENTQLGDSVITLNLTVLPTKTGEDFATIRDYEIYYYEGDSLSKAGDYTYTLVAANGCDSVVTLHLTVLATMYRTENATICANQSYTFYDEVYSQAGQYTHRIENTQLGDSVITLNLTVLPTKTGEDFATIRDYEVYYYENDSLSKAGDYTYTLVAANGCDSTVTLHLTVLETMYRTENATICANQSYTFYDEVYSQAGQYTHRIENAQLGDSVITLNLTVLPTKTGEDFATIRDYEIYYYEGDSLSKAGDYTYTLVAENGCDSTVTLHLTVLETMYRTEEATICSNQSYTFYDEVYSQAGQYTHRIENTQLGDSVITLNLTVLPTKTGEDFATIRDYEIYYYEGDSLSKAGDYTYTLVAANGCDSTVTLHLTVLETMYRTENATICSNSSYTFYGDAYTEAGQYTHRIENAQLGDSVITLNLTVLPTATAEIEATIIESGTYMFGGQELTEAGVYVDTLVSTIGCDSVVTLTLRVVALCSEYVVVNEPKEVVYYGDSTDIAPVVSLVCPSHDAVIEWGRVLNYNPMADGKVDVMNPVEYETLQVASMSEYQGDTLTSIFQYGSQDRTQYFYYLVWQCDETKEMHLFHFEHVGQVNSIWVNYDAPKRDQLITSAATVSVDEANPQTVTVAWYNTTDTLTPATGNFVHGQTYYAVVTTPMTEILGENYHIDATTAIVWGEEQQPKALTNGLLRSPMYTMENVTWTFRLEDAQLAPDGQASISACAEPSVSLSDTNSVVLNWQLSIDTINWMTLSDTLGYNIDHHSYCSDIHFPATLLRAGTYYIRVRALYQGETFFSRTAELVIQAGIVMAEEAVQQTTVTETGEEVATVQYNFDETENVGVLTLTNSTNVGSPTTAVAITSNTVVEIVGANTVLSEEAGFESSGDLEFVGRVDSTQVDEDGNTIYAALDSMSIVSRRPLYAPGQGVKVTFNGIYMTLTVYGHEDDNLVPSRSAARAQMKRAYSKAHAALEAAGDESVISGFDEADFINCGIIEPEGAEYDEDNLELMDDGDPVYNCTIAPTDIPTDPMSTGMVKDVIRAEKRIVNDIIYIFRQDKTYTMMGQAVK